MIGVSVRRWARPVALLACAPLLAALADSSVILANSRGSRLQPAPDRSWLKPASTTDRAETLLAEG
jgi:hypothetical protein